MLRQDAAMNVCFSKSKIVADGVKKEILKDCAKKEAHFICHKATEKGKDICCRGFYDQEPDATNLMRVARRLGMIRFVDLY